MLTVWVPILPEHIWSKVSGKDAANKYANTPPFVGSGPFQCVEWKKNSFVKLAANPGYWRGAPTIEELFFDYYTNPDTMVQDLKAGTIDGATGLLDAQYRQLLNVPGIQARTINTNGFDQIGFNCYAGPSRGNPVLKDWKFRQALNWAIDKDKIASVSYGGHAVPATTIITADYYTDPDWHWEPPTDVAYGFDLEAAKQKLDEAGYKDTDGDGIRDYQGKPIDLRLWARSESTISQSVSKLVAGSLKDVGLKVTLQTMDDGALTDQLYATKNDVFNPDYDLFLWGWYSDLDPSPILSYFTTDQINGWSDCAWSNKEYDAAVPAAVRGHRPDRAQGAHRQDAGDHLPRVAVHPDGVLQRPRGLQHRQVGGLRGIAEQDRQRPVPALRPGRQRELPAHPAQDGRDDRRRGRWQHRALGRHRRRRRDRHPAARAGAAAQEAADRRGLRATASRRDGVRRRS